MFPTRNLLELGGDECDNLNFMNYTTDIFKIRKSSGILGTFKIHKIQILNLCHVQILIHVFTEYVSPNIEAVLHIFAGMRFEKVVDGFCFFFLWMHCVFISTYTFPQRLFFGASAGSLSIISSDVV